MMGIQICLQRELNSNFAMVGNVAIKHNGNLPKSFHLRVITPCLIQSVNYLKKEIKTLQT